jgi:hypothetical protein
LMALPRRRAVMRRIPGGHGQRPVHPIHR